MGGPGSGCHSAVSECNKLRVWRGFWCCRASFRTFEGNEGSGRIGGPDSGCHPAVSECNKLTVWRGFWCFREESWPWIRLTKRWEWRNSFPGYRESFGKLCLRRWPNHGQRWKCNHYGKQQDKQGSTPKVVPGAALP